MNTLVRTSWLLDTRLSNINLIRFYSDGYRLALKPSSRKVEENKTESEKFQEHIEKCLLNKARSPLRGMERVHPKTVPAVSPNDKFLGKTNLPTYGSVQSYAKAAERERKNQQQNGVPWHTMSQFYKEMKGDVTFANIGDELPSSKFNVEEYKKILFENKEKLEESARKRTLKIDESSITDQWESTTQGMKSINQVLHHYDIFKHLFGNNHFYPLTRMDVGYADGDDEVNPVFYGNELSPSDTNTAPLVTYESDPDQMWSLLLVNLDGNLENSNRQNLHWMVSNIKGNDVVSGDVMADYLTPLPMRGTGYHRMVFLLFRQKHELYLDVRTKGETAGSPDLKARSFSTKTFYKRYHKFLTPTSIRFFQTIWDEKVQETFHHLGLAEPVYQYEVPDLQPHTLRRFPIPSQKRTLLWLQRFMPEEPIFPGGGRYD